jgi:hypothetical protein
MLGDTRGRIMKMGVIVPGPFHRLESPTQDKTTARQQGQAMEIWGRAAQGSNILSVKAYRSGLPAGRRGIEFDTPVAPHPGGGTPYEARWYYPNTVGVRQRTNGTDQFACISLSRFVNQQP